MSKKTIRFIALLLSCFMVVAVFVGCSQKDKTSDNAGKGEQTSSEQKQDGQKDQGEPPVIKIALRDTKPEEGSPIIEAMEKKYNAKFNFDWTIDYKKFNEVLGVKLSSGDMPDYIEIPDSGNLDKLIQQGVAAPITDEMKAKIPSYFKVVEKYDVNDNLWVDAMYNGQLYGLKPISPQGAYPTVLVWRTDWLKNVGIDSIPKTLTEFEEAMYKFVKNDPDKDGKNNTYGLSETSLNGIFGAFGAVPMKQFRGQGRQTLFMTKKDGKVTFAVTQPEMKEALALLQKWYKDGIIDPEFITGENKGGYWAVSHAFVNGTVGVTGMVLSTHWNPPLTKDDTKGGAVYEEMIAANPGAKFGETFDIGNGPVGPDGKSGTHQWGAVNANVNIFSTECVKDERKVNILLQMIEDNFSDFDQYVLVNHGIEGNHYTKNQDGRYIINTEKYPKLEDRKRAGVHALTLMNQPDFMKQINPPYYEFIEKYKGTGYVDERYPTTPAFTKHISSLQRLSLESYMAIITGEKSVDYFDEFVETFKANGGDEIEKEINEQLAKNMGK